MTCSLFCFSLKTRLLGLAVGVLSLSAAAGTEGTIRLADYWFMPPGLVASTCNLTWSGELIFGEHCFGSGLLAGRVCRLQGDPGMGRYDIMEQVNGDILYWGSFRGNGSNDPVSHIFRSPMRWGRAQMAPGDRVDSQVYVEVLSPSTRDVKHRGVVGMHLQLNAHYDRWTIPETGVSYKDVVSISFWSDSTRPESREDYHLAKGKGTIRFVSFNQGEPSGVRAAWAVAFRNQTFDDPVLPWCALFGAGEPVEPVESILP